jgi:hypothetical protein
MGKNVLRKAMPLGVRLNKPAFRTRADTGNLITEITDLRSFRAISLLELQRPH